MALLFGVCFFLYFLKLSAGKGYCVVSRKYIASVGSADVDMQMLERM